MHVYVSVLRALLRQEGVSILQWLYSNLDNGTIGYHEAIHEAPARRAPEEDRIAIELPRVELEHLPQAPLQVAIAQVRFSAVFAIENRGELSGFQQRLGDRYLAREQSPPRFGALGRAATPHVPSLEQETVWQFEEPEREWTISLSSTGLALEAARYLDFDDFAGELARIVEALAEEFDPQREVRLGVRYVNRIEDRRLSGKNGVTHFISEQLASPVGGELGSDLLGSLSELRFRENGGTLAIRHGLIEPRRYLLDFDRFAEKERQFAPASIVKRVRRFHALIEQLFVWSLSPGYLDELRGRAG